MAATPIAASRPSEDCAYFTRIAGLLVLLSAFVSIVCAERQNKRKRSKKADQFAVGFEVLAVDTDHVADENKDEDDSPLEKIKTTRFRFEDVYIAYEGAATLASDVSSLSFSEIFPELKKGSQWMVATSASATLSFAGYPAHVYSCEKAERVGYLEFQSASTPYTVVSGRQIDYFIDVESLIDSGDVQLAERFFRPYADLYEIEPWRRFGRNGKQVVALIEWWRSKIALEDLAPLEALRQRYLDRAVLKWPQSKPMLFSFASNELDPAKPSWQPWKRGKALAAAWAAAMDVAAKRRNGIWWAARYVAHAAPGFVAVVLRDILEPRYFEELYADMNDSYPLSTLDAEVPPVGYKA